MEKKIGWQSMQRAKQLTAVNLHAPHTPFSACTVYWMWFMLVCAPRSTFKMSIPNTRKNRNKVNQIDVASSRYRNQCQESPAVSLFPPCPTTHITLDSKQCNQRAKIEIRTHNTLPLNYSSAFNSWAQYPCVLSCCIFVVAGKGCDAHLTSAAIHLIRWRLM